MQASVEQFTQETVGQPQLEAGRGQDHPLGFERVGEGHGVGRAGQHRQTPDVGRFVHALPRLARDGGVRLLEVSPADESLESVFAYLVAR